MNKKIWTKAFSAALLGFSLVGCSVAEEANDEPRQTDVTIKKHQPVKKTPSVIEVVSPLKELNANAAKLVLPNRTGKPFVQQPLTYRLADVLKKRAKNPKSFEEKLQLNWTSASESLVDFITLAKENLNFEVIIDSGVKGTVQSEINLIGDNMISRYDAWKLFEEILYMSGAYATLDPSGIIRISPFIKMPKEKRLLIKGEPRGNASVELIELRHNQASDILTNLRPFMTDGASATILTKSNSILLVETPANMEKLHALVKLLDNKGQAGWPQFAYQCKKIDSATLLGELQTLIPVLGFNITQGNNADPSGIKIGSLDRLSVIVLSAPTAEVLNEIKGWIVLLDTADSGEEEKVFYYPVKHGVANDLATAISTFFPNTTSGGGSTSGSSSSTNSGGGNRSTSSRGGISAQQLNRRPSTPRTTPQRGNATASSTEEVISIFDMPVTVYEDTRRNQLVVRAAPKTYAMLQAILNHLDAPPMQVLITMTAVEVNLTDDLQYGFEYAAEAAFGKRTGTVGAGNALSAAVPAFIPGTSGITALLQEAGVANEFAFAQAVAGKANTRILFCPQILSMNGEEAQINVGREIPVQIGTSTTDGTVQDNIEYRDTGTILTVTPQISSDKRVTLQVEVELSSLSEDVVEGIESPIINENLVRTRFVVDNNETILIGGIISKTKSDTSSGVPILKDIPLIGFLFSGITDNSSKQELVIFVKATVIETKSDYEKAMLRYKEALKYKKRSPELDK